MNLQNQQRLAGIIVLSVLIILLSPLLFTANTNINLPNKQFDVTPPKSSTTLNIPKGVEKSLPFPNTPVQKSMEISLENTSAKLAANQSAQAVKKISVKTALPSKTKQPEKAIFNSTKNLLWTVQVGCFANQIYLNRLLDQLQSDGYLVTLHKMNVGYSTLTKVLVGKETSQDAAKQLADQIERRFKLKGNVVKYSL